MKSTKPDYDAIALDWLVMKLGYPRKGLERELGDLLRETFEKGAESVPARAAQNAPAWVLERGTDSCRCCCRSCAEDDHCGEGRQVGLGDCLLPPKEPWYPPVD